jgi:VanZ family protein
VITNLTSCASRKPWPNKFQQDPSIIPSPDNLMSMRSIFAEKPDPLLLRQRTSGVGQVGVWLPALIAVALVFAESTEIFSAKNTNSWLRPVFEWFLGPMQDTRWNTLHHLLRKLGHFCGYGFVCLTFLRAWLLTLGSKPYLSVCKWRLGSCALAVASTVVIACLDEWHQTFLPGRTGRVSDVGIDTLGAVLACALIWSIRWQTA